jgi:hypothetical protein
MIFLLVILVHPHEVGCGVALNRSELAIANEADLWKANLKSARALADEDLLKSINGFFEDSQGIYHSPRIHRDLREGGVKCEQKRVARSCANPS